MNGQLKHRGPDHAGLWFDADRGVGLGHTRLAIIDLSPAGEQPMPSANGKCWVTFNGEIYNFPALREKLTNAGHQFRGHSDTEVLVESIAAFGIEQTLEQIDGMFAFAAWLPDQNQLVIARDRLGKKPLYYGWQGHRFFFASELKALQAHPAFNPEINRSALALFMRHSYIPSPYCIFNGINKVNPGEMIGIDLKAKTCNAKSFWSLSDKAVAGRSDSFDLSEHELLDRLDEVVTNAVQRRLISDVPLGAFLSGGIDSSLIVALMQKLSDRPVRTFTIGFEDKKFDESEAAKAMAKHLGTDHTEFILKPEVALDVVQDLPTVFDEPFADISQIPTIMVCRQAKTQLTVALSGDGGDEFFAGYDRYINAIDRFPERPGIDIAFKKMLGCSAQALSRLLPSYPALARYGAYWSASDRVDLFCKRFERIPNANTLVLGSEPLSTVYSNRAIGITRLNDVERMMLMDGQGWLTDDVLTKVDRASMSTSLEVRSPLLDSEVVRFAWRIPLDWKLREGKRKWLLRELLARYAPRDLWDRPKRGFAVPTHAWLTGPLRDWAEELLDAKRIASQGYLCPKTTQGYWKAMKAGGKRYRQAVWNILMFQAWLDRHDPRNPQQ